MPLEFLKSLKNRLKTSVLGPSARQAMLCLLPRKAAILRYHSILRDPDPFLSVFGQGTIHPQSEFEHQMEYIATRCTPVTLTQVGRALREGQPLPHRAVAVTFDDGFRDNFEIAAPILDRFQIPGHFFVTVGSVETGVPPWFCRLRYAFRTSKNIVRENGDQDHFMGDLYRPDVIHEFEAVCRRCARLSGCEQEQFVVATEKRLEVPSDVHAARKLMMDWSQIRALRDAGHIVGSHSMTHPNLAYVTAETARWEMCQSKAILERELKLAVSHFAYPSPILDPNWTAETIELSKEIGFETAVASIPGAVHRSSSPWVLPRISVPQSYGKEFEWKVEASLLGIAT